MVARLYDDTWPRLAARTDLSAEVRDLGERLQGQVVAVEQQLVDAGPLTLIHGDASAQNIRTSTDGAVALLDWEDVSAAPGVLDLAWFLVSSVEPTRWAEALDAYGPAAGLRVAMPSTVVQGLLSMADWPEGSPEALGWNERLAVARSML